MLCATQTHQVYRPAATLTSVGAFSPAMARHPRAVGGLILEHAQAVLATWRLV